MDTKIIYLDETGDDGANTSSSDLFVLTAIIIDTKDWLLNENKFKSIRKCLKERHQFPIGLEFHTKQFMTDKDPYRNLKLMKSEKKELLDFYIDKLNGIKYKALSVIFDKTQVLDEKSILDRSLRLLIDEIMSLEDKNIQFIIVSDEGHIGTYRKFAKYEREKNRISNIKWMIEDIFEKNSSESHFIQLADLISFLTFLYYKGVIKNQKISNRVSEFVYKDEIIKYFIHFEKSEKFYFNQNLEQTIGFIVFPKKNTT